MNNALNQKQHQHWHHDHSWRAFAGFVFVGLKGLIYANHQFNQSDKKPLSIG